MSNRVVIMKVNPGEIKEIIDIDMAYPQERTDPKFIEYRNYIFDSLNI